jgi:phage host-nuclease inhibitor protein Gam
MARKKPKLEVAPIQDITQANAVLGRIAECSRELAGLEADLNRAIDLAKAQHEAQAAPIRARIEQMEASLHAFAEYQKTVLFTEKRSIECIFGTFGFRASTKIKPATKETFTTILEKLKQFGFREAIRTKEEVNKEVLNDWPGW